MLERLARLIMPPMVRESIVGDLVERYRSPLQFAAETVRVLPFVIIGQFRRSTEAPMLMLQAFILLACLGGFHPRNDAAPFQKICLAHLVKTLAPIRRCDSRTAVGVQAL